MTTARFLSYAFIVCVAIALAYLPGLHAPFLFDDFPNIVFNRSLQINSLFELDRVLDSPYSPSRPLALASFALNYLSSGLSASSFRLTNITIHILNCLLLFTISYHLLRQYYKDADWQHHAQIAFWAALLWALNPVQTQAVTLIVQRMTSLASLFYLGGVLTFILIRRSKISPILGMALIIACFLLGMATKEIVATLPVALYLLELLFFRQEKAFGKIDILIVSIIIAAGFTVLYVKAPSAILQFFDTYSNRMFSPYERLLTETRVLNHYLSLLVFPEVGRLRLDYDIPISRSLISPVTTLFSTLSLLGIAFAAFYFRRRWVFLSLFTGFFLLGNLIESSILNLELVFIHRLYLPSIFFYLALLAHIPLHMYRKISIIVVCLFAFFTFSTFERNSEWRTGDTFWEENISRGGEFERSAVNYAANLIVLGKHQKATLFLRNLLQNNESLNPEKPKHQEHLRKLQYLLGQSHFLAGEYEAVIASLQPLYNQTGNVEHLYYLAMAKLLSGKDFPVEQTIKDIWSKSPVYACLLGAQYLETQKKYNEQEKLLNNCDLNLKSLALLDRNTLKMYLANAYIKQNMFNKAKEVYLQITETDPENIAAWQQLYRMMISGNNHAEAKIIKRFLSAKGAAIPLQP